MIKKLLRLQIFLSSISTILAILSNNVSATVAWILVFFFYVQELIDLK